LHQGVGEAAQRFTVRQTSAEIVSAMLAADMA
jgi:hypothetical protein